MHASSWTCMQAHGSAICMQGHGSACILNENSGTICYYIECCEKVEFQLDNGQTEDIRTCRAASSQLKVEYSTSSYLSSATRERTMSEIDILQQCNFDTPLTIVDWEGEHWSGLEPIILNQFLALTPAGHVIQRQNLENSNTNIKLFIFFETRGF